MKELSIEEKAKRYEEALERAKTSFESANGMILKKRLVGIFPELAESEDERIRKALIKLVKKAGEGYENVIDGVSIENAISWLEKQGEQKPADKVEPKFHEGDWIVHHGTENIYQVVAVIDNHYQLKYGDNYTVQECADVDRCARLWDITKDAKAGDVLVLNNEVFIYAHRKQLYSIAVAHCFVDSAGGFYLDGEFGHTEKGNSIYPATKEQRDTLIKAMAEAGYTFDFEKKKLKKIGQKLSWSESDSRMFQNAIFYVEFYRTEKADSAQAEATISWLKSLKDRIGCEANYITTKEWSEEDEKQRRQIERIVSNDGCTKKLQEQIHNWLKSIKDRVQPQPKQEWSKEDKNMLQSILDEYKSMPIEKRNWLKSLRPQSQWKPSREQMIALKCAITTADEKWVCMNTKDLESLYQDLKKLMEE